MHCAHLWAMDLNLEQEKQKISFQDVENSLQGAKTTVAIHPPEPAGQDYCKLRSKLYRQLDGLEVSNTARNTTMQTLGIQLKEFHVRPLSRCASAPWPSRSKPLTVNNFALGLDSVHVRTSSHRLLLPSLRCSPRRPRPSR